MKEKFLHEIPEKRDRFTKHFQTGDKQCVAAVYPRPVHYEEDGQWKEIDNRLELQSEDGKEYYGNRASALQVRFAKEAGKGSLVILKKEGHEISWDLAGAQDAAGAMAKGKEVPEKAFRVREKEPPSGSQKGPKEKKMEAVHLISEGDYEDILPGVDLSYHINGEGLKENITFKTKEAAMQEIVFRIRHKGLELRTVNDGASAYGLFEKDKEDPVYTFELPYMYDAAGHICEDVELLAEAGQDMSILKVLQDKEWLSDAGRTYPVVIDPMVETIKNKRNIYDAFVKERDPAATRNYHYFRVGYESSQYGACRGFLKFKELPVIGDGSIVTKAYMNVYQYGYDYWNVNAKIPITAHAVNASWDPATITWNTQPSVSDEVLDVKEIGNVISGNTISFTPITFDVTKLIRSWYNTGNNNGICLKSMYEVPENNDHKSCGKFFASDYPLTGAQYQITEDMYPCGIIEYRCVTGLEGYQSYHEQDLGHSGKGYTNDYTGNLVWTFTDVSTTGGIMPLSLGHVYNMADRNVKTCAGYGWRLTAQQELKTTGIEKSPYVYKDADGTDHYFYKDGDDGDKLKDEDGLGLTITQESSSTSSELYRIMETKDGVKYFFASDGYLRKIQDPDGNAQTYAYNNGKLVTLTDGAGDTISLTYNEAGLINTATYEADNGTKVITYSYTTAGDLQFVNYPDGKSDKYHCDAQHRLMSLKNHDKRKVTYSFANDFAVPRVSRVVQTGSDNDENGGGGTTGRVLDISYVNGNTTVFSECGLDGDIGGTADNRTYTYHFDDAGRPSCIVMDDGRAADYGYYTEGVKNHKLMKEGRTQATTYNLMRNPCLMQNFVMTNTWASYIVPEGATGSSAVMEANKFFTDNPVHGKGFWKEAGLDVVKAVSGTAAQKTGIIQRITLQPGTYTFSGRAAVTSMGTGTAEGNGACLMVLMDGNYLTSKVLHEASDMDVEHGWRDLSVTFTVDERKQIGFIAGIKDAQGEAYFSGLMLEAGDAASRLNMICNGGFTNVPSGVPAAWTYDAADTAVRYKTDSEKGASAYLMGEHTKDKKLYQQISCYGEKGDVYSLSGWAKGCGIPDGTFKMSVDVTHTDNTTKTYDFDFERNITAWQFRCGMLRTEKDYKAIKVSLHYSKQCNEAFFKGIQLVKDDGESYVYDDKGNLISAVSAASSGQFMHGEKDTLTRMSDISGSSFEYGYDSKKHVVSAKNSQGVQYHFGYNNKGLPEKTLVLGGKRRRVFTEDRTYYLRENVSGNYLQAGNPSSTEHASTAVFMPFSGGDSQKWKITDAGDGQLRITPISAQDKALEVKDGLDVDYTNVQISTYDGADKQKWQLHPMASGAYEISCKCTSHKKALSNAGSSTASGHVVQSCLMKESRTNQHWFLEPVEEGLAVTDEPKAGHIFGIRVRHSGNYIHVPDGNSGTACQAARSLGNEHQMFLLEDAGNGYFYIRSILNEASGKEAQVIPMVLSANAAGQVLLKQKSTSDNGMKFKFTATTAGQTYRIVDMNNKVIKVPDASYDNNKALASASQGSGREEQWILEDLGERISSSVTYDTKGRVQTVTDSKGNVSRNTYSGRLLTSVQDAKESQIHYGYDSSERIISVSDKADPAAADAVAVTYGYEGEYLKNISHNDFSYEFDYDVFGNRTAVKVKNGTAEQTLMTTAYRNANGPVHSQTYGNGDSIRYEYDKEERVTGIYKTNSGTEVKASEHVYDKNGVLICHKDLENAQESRYHYDLAGRITGMDRAETGGKDLTLRTGYDEKDRVAAHTQKLSGSAAVKRSYRYGDAAKGEEPGLIYGMSVNGTERESYTYDGLGRIVKKTLHLNGGAKWETEYTYCKGGLNGSTTLLVESVKDKDKTLFYEYDAVGNIVRIQEQLHGGAKTDKATYGYDHLGQLIRENNGWTNETVVYTYDKGGNMTRKDVYNYTTGTPSVKKDSQCAEYTYGNSWKDQLTNFKYAGGLNQPVTYDGAGNPDTYRGMALTWKDGRKLSIMRKLGGNASYSYDQNGDRIKKTVEGVVTKFHTDGGKILIMEKDGKEVHFLYDQEGSLFGMKVVNGTSVADYYYEKNLQGDIVGVIDSTGNRIVSYKYDSWGRMLTIEGSMAATIGVLNPFRYRGYFYDEETGFYYVSSRYYDPEVGRFISADTTDILGVSSDLYDKNLYAYCDNNPVMRIDENGDKWEVAGAIIGGAAIVGLGIATAMTGGTAAIILGAAFSGSIVGGGIGAGIGLATGGIDGALVGFGAGAVAGGVIGAAAAGFNIGTGATTIINKAHGSTLHKMASNIEAGKMAASGKYSQIGLNTSLKKMGLNGGLKRPDVTGIAKRGANKIVEVVSPRQSTAYVRSKMTTMKARNPGIVGKVVTWVRNLFR